MNVDVERINIANAVIKAFVEEKEFSSKLDDMAKKDLKNVKMDGFRPGKTPLKLLKQKFSKELQESVEQSFVQTIFQDGLKKIGVSKEDVLGEPIFDKFDSVNNTMDIVMRVSLKPIFKLADYNECVPEIKEQSVTKKEVDERMEQMASSYTEPQEVKGRDIVQDKDFANIDFEGFIDDKAFEGGSAKDFALEIGSKSFIDTFEEQIIGMKIGDNKDINVVFPKNYQKAELSDKKAVFKVKLNSIKVKDTLSVNDELAQKVLTPQKDKDGKEKKFTLKDLEVQLKENISREKKNAYYADLKKDFFDKLIEQLEDFPLPENIIEQEIVSMSRQKINEMDDKEVEELKEDSKKVDEIRESCKDEATKRVRLTFIIDAIAQKEDISITEQQLMQEVYTEALYNRQDPREMYEAYRKNNLIPALRMALVEDKLTAKLFDKKLESKKKVSGDKK